MQQSPEMLKEKQNQYIVTYRKCDTSIILQRFCSILAERSQKVMLENGRLVCGYLEGSVSHAVYIYMKLLGEIQGFGMEYHQYADDTKFACAPSLLSTKN